jgi:hypothetical protein
MPLYSAARLTVLGLLSTQAHVSLMVSGTGLVLKWVLVLEELMQGVLWGWMDWSFTSTCYEATRRGVMLLANTGLARARRCLNTQKLRPNMLRSSYALEIAYIVITHCMKKIYGAMRTLVACMHMHIIRTADGDIHVHVIFGLSSSHDHHPQCG